MHTDRRRDSISILLSRSATRDTTLIYHVHNYITITKKNKKESKILKILYPSLSAKFSLAFYEFKKKNSYFSTGIYSIPNFKLCKNIGKVVIK